MKVGYARVSTSDQHLDLQIKSLREMGCEKIFTDRASGAKSARLGLLQAIDFVREGDIIVVWKLDRLGRSLTHLIDTINTFEKMGVGFQSITESIDTNTPGGKLIFHVFGALAEFERELIRERTRAGLKAAKARGRNGGRPKKLMPKQVEMARSMLLSNKYKVKEVCEIFNVSKATLYRNIKHLEEREANK